MLFFQLGEHAMMAYRMGTKQGLIVVGILVPLSFITSLFRVNAAVNPNEITIMNII
jgi:hypothetical protein